MSQTNQPIIEPFPHKVAEISELLSELQQQEQKIEKHRRNKDVRQQYEQQAENSRQQLLKQADSSLVYNYLEASRIADKNALRTAWQQNLPPVSNQEWIEFITVSPPDLNLLPFGSFFIQFEFKLLKPYISRDDNSFYIIDNPIVRDKVFRYPMIRSTAWKGSLWHALWQLEHDEDDEQIQRLFGKANDDDDTGERGRLYFYPTFFDRIGLEIINPHDRERRVGKNLILFECVPAGTTGHFTLLYVPLDRIGKEEANPEKDIHSLTEEVAADLPLLAQGLEALFTVYGFGAKTSSGYGLAVNTVAGGEIVVGGLTCAVESSTPAAALPISPQPELPRYLDAPNRLHPDFVAETGGIKSEAEYRKLLEARGQNFGKPHRQLYAKAKSWWEREGQQLAQQQQEPAPESRPIPIAAPPYPFVQETFDAFANLPTKAQAVADALRQTGGEE